MLIFTSCGSNKGINQSKKVVEGFFKNYYRIEDYTKILDYSSIDEDGMKKAEELKPYLTEKLYDEFFNTRQTFTPAKLADKHKGNMSVESVSFTKEQADKKTGNVILDCNVVITIKSQDGKSIKSYDRKTVIKVIKDNGGYKISGGKIGLLGFRED